VNWYKIAIKDFIEHKRMQLEDYFEFLDPDDIRIKGHRIGIDNVIKNDG
jgi:hypothetical protein